MKKTSRERLRKKLKAGIKRWKLRLKRIHLEYGRHKIPKVHQSLGCHYITAPTNISIYDLDQNQRDYIDTINFLGNLEKNIEAGNNCVINFGETSRITAAALVVVYASIESANKPTNKKIGIIWSKSSHVNLILKTSNLYKLMLGQEFNYALDSSRNMPIISSTGREQMDEIVDFIQKNIYKDMMSPATEHVYGDAVSETINNVGLHAYPNSHNDDKRWWLMCETRGKKLYLAIYDRGVGIPETVVDRPWFLRSLSKLDPDLYRELNSLLPNGHSAGLKLLTYQRIPDQKLIQLSMQGDISGTKKDKHGQGSKSIMALVSDTNDGVLWVFSNRGVYNFNQEGQIPGLSKLDKKFPGTLVQWNIELP